MRMPSGQMVRIDGLNSQIASQWLVDDTEYVCQSVFPWVPAAEIGGRIVRYDRRDWFRSSDVTPRQMGTESNGTGYAIDLNRWYFCQEYAIHVDVPDELRAMSQAPINADRDATSNVVQKIKLFRDVIFSNRYFQSGFWTADLTATADASVLDPYSLSIGAANMMQWDDYITPSTPQKDIDALRRWIMLASGLTSVKYDLTLVIGRAVWDALKNHPSIVARYVYTQGVPVLTEQLVANYLQVKRIVVADTVTNVGPMSGQWQGQFAFGSHALLVFVPQAPSLTQPSAGYTFGYTGANHQGANVQIERFRLANDAKADRIVGNIHLDMTYVEKILAVFIKNAVSTTPGPVILDTDYNESYTGAGGAAVSPH